MTVILKPFLLGDEMKIRKKNGLVRGVGINDSDSVIGRNSIINGKQVSVWRCPIYRCWVRMLERCYSDIFHARWPTYAGCSMVDDWHRFSNFRAWMASQNFAGLVVDKDILFVGNKIYGPKTCIFIREELNLFLTDHGRGRGKWPVGAFFDKGKGRFRGMCRNPFSGKQESLGTFDSADLAHEAWRARKHQHACRYAEMQTDPRIAQALRTRYMVDKELN